MSHLELKIELDNDAFAGKRKERMEIATILSLLAEYIDAHGADHAHSRRLMDTNGNTVGEVKVIRD